MLSSNQLPTRDFNFGALGQMEMRNPQADKKGGIHPEVVQGISDASLRVSA
jgi:hypothetical protein